MRRTFRKSFLELILVELKNARIVDSVRGAKGGYQLRRKASEIHLSEIMRLIDGPLAPFGDADSLRDLIESDGSHRALYQVFCKCAMRRLTSWRARRLLILHACLRAREEVEAR